MAKVTERITLFRTALASLSRGEQKSIFNGLVPEFQAAIWQDRLAQSIQEISDQSQKKFISEICDQIYPESYSNEESNKEFREIILKAESTANEIFEDFNLYNTILTSLGDDPCPTQVVKQAGPPACDCSSGFSRGTSGSGNDCPALIRCTAGGCTTSRLGCGSLWLWSCDGLCP